MMRGAFYVRVSTEDQTELSPDAQLRALREYAKKNKILVSEEHIFIDEGISAKTAKRPAFQQMIKTAKLKPKPFDIIMVHKFDRFARNREDSVVFKSLLRKECEIRVVSITEHIEDDKFAVILEAMLEAMAEYYSLNLADEVKKGMSEKARKGGFLTRPPFGYTIEEEGQPPVIVPEEAKIVELIFDKFVNQNWTYYSIAKYLINVLNIKLPSGNDFSLQRVKYILRNPLYCGLIQWNAGEECIESEGLHQAIITKETYTRAQNKIDSIKRATPKNTKPVEFAAGIFTSLLRCSNCGAKLSYNTRKTGPYYQCNNYNEGKCKVSHSISEKKILKGFMQQIKFDYEYEAIAGTLNIKNLATTSVDSELEILDRQINSLEAKFVRIKEAYAAGIDSLEEYGQNKKRLLKEEAELEERRYMLLNNDGPQEDLTGFINLLKRAYDILSSNDVSVVEKNKILRTFVEQIVYNKHDKTLSLIYYRSDDD